MIVLVDNAQWKLQALGRQKMRFLHQLEFPLQRAVGIQGDAELKQMEGGPQNPIAVGQQLGLLQGNADFQRPAGFRKDFGVGFPHDRADR